MSETIEHLAHSKPELDAKQGIQSPHADEAFFNKRTASTDFPLTKVAFGPFRLLPTQFLLLEGENPVPLGSRALGILVALLERRGELVSKHDLMARVWPNVSVEANNLTVHMSALRRALRDGRDGHRFIVNIPGRGYCFVAPVDVSGHEN
jgi:DNA-binding winged helix-turn-helix (wHTH) protein